MHNETEEEVRAWKAMRDKTGPSKDRLDGAMRSMVRLREEISREWKPATNEEVAKKERVLVRLKYIYTELVVAKGV